MFVTKKRHSVGFGEQKSCTVCVGAGRKSAGKATFPLKRHEWLNRRPRGLYSLPLLRTQIYFCPLSGRRLFISATKDTRKTKNREPKFKLLFSTLRACKYFPNALWPDKNLIIPIWGLDFLLH